MLHGNRRRGAYVTGKELIRLAGLFALVEGEFMTLEEAYQSFWYLLDMPVPKSYERILKAVK